MIVDRGAAGHRYGHGDVIFWNFLIVHMHEHFENREGYILRRVNGPRSRMIAAATGLRRTCTAQIRVLGADKPVNSHA